METLRGYGGRSMAQRFASVRNYRYASRWRIETLSFVGLLCLSASILSGCQRTDNIQTGETEYPEENSGAAQIVRLRGTLSATVPIHLTADYAAGLGGFGGVDDCSFHIALSETRPFWIQVPINVVRMGSTYSGEIAIDRYKPGRCNWKLLGISYWLTQSQLDPGEQSPEAYADAQQVTSPNSIATNPQQDVWCVKSTDPVEVRRPYKCGPLSFIAPSSAAAREQPKAIEEQQLKTRIVYLNTQTVTINFQLVEPASSDVGAAGVQ